MRRTRHAFEPARHHALRMRQGDRLRCQNQRFETRGADFVNGRAGHLWSESALESSLASGGLSLPRSEHVSENDFVDLPWIETDGVEGGSDGVTSQVAGLEGTESAVEAADGGALGSQDEHLADGATG